MRRIWNFVYELLKANMKFQLLFKNITQINIKNQLKLI